MFSIRLLVLLALASCAPKVDWDSYKYSTGCVMVTSGGLNGNCHT